jgi:hypothetical protein
VAADERVELMKSWIVRRLAVSSIAWLGRLAVNRRNANVMYSVIPADLAYGVAAIVCHPDARADGQRLAAAIG